MASAVLGPPMDLVPPPLAVPMVGDAAAAALFDFVTVALRHAPLVVFLVLQLYVAGAGSAEAEESCSKALGFNESLPPKDRSRQDLNFCTEHHTRTCCERNHTRSVLSLYSAFSFERSASCTQMSRLALCAFCDADVGTGLKSQQDRIVLCSSFCERWFQACYNDFFTSGGSGAGLNPCTPSALVCSPLGEITDTAREFCEKVGLYDIAKVEDEEHDACYDGVPAAKIRGRGPRAPWTPPSREVPPWWKRLWPPSSWPRLPPSIEAQMPGFVVACVAMLFAFFLLRGD